MDSIISGVLLSKLLTYLNIENEFVILDEKISKESVDIVKRYGINTSDYQKNTLSENLFLVDHYKTVHNGDLVACLDHHPTIEVLDKDIYDNRASSSCAKIVYDYMVKYNYPIDRDIILLVVLSIFVDTNSLKSSKTLESDKVWTKNICSKYNLSYEILYQEGLCLTDLSTTLEEIVLTTLHSHRLAGSMNTNRLQ